MGRLWRAKVGMLVIASIMLCAPVTADPSSCMHQMGVGVGPLPPPSCLPPDAPPRDFTATFDTATQVLTLTWTAPDSATAPDSYQVYRDGNRLGATTTDTSSTDDLTGFYGYHTYWVTATWGTHTGDASLPIFIGKSGGTPTSCPIYDVSIYTSPTFVGAGVHDECLPP